MSASADLAPLLRQALAGDGLELHTGELVAWNPSTLENTVRVAGAELANLPILNGDTITLAAGDTLALVRSRAAYVVLGKLASA